MKLTKINKKMTNIGAKYWLISILAILIVSVFAINLPKYVLAEEVKDPNMDNFKVGEYLRAKDQGQKYFEEAKTKKTSPIGAFLLETIDYMLMTIGTVAIGTIVVGGLMLMTAQGQENQLDKGKNAIKFALIGLVVAFSAYIISVFVQSIFYVS